MSKEHEEAFDKEFGEDSEYIERIKTVEKKSTNYSNIFTIIILGLICSLLLSYIINIKNACRIDAYRYCNSTCPLCIKPSHPYYDPNTGAIVYPNQTIEEEYEFPIFNTT